MAPPRELDRGRSPTGAGGFTAGASSPPRRPAELLVPPKTLAATRGAREAEGRIGVGLDFTQPVAYSNAVNRYARFVNQAHPGPHAPLGWTQSHASEAELTAQLAQVANVSALAQVREWLTPGMLKCAPAAAGGRKYSAQPTAVEREDAKR